MDTLVRTRTFVLLVGALPAVALAQFDAPINSRDLARGFSEAHFAGDYTKAIDVGLRWVRLKPKDDGAAYNLACAYALHGDEKTALTYLRKSVENGWDDPGHLSRDTDLDSLHGLPEFDEVIELAKEKARPRYEAGARSEPIIIVPSKYDAGAPAPVIMALHGYGSNAESFTEMWKNVAERTQSVLVMPRSITAINLGGGKSWNNPEEAEVIVLSSLEKVREGYNVNRERVVITGFSEGADMALHIGIRHTDKFRGVIPVAGRYNAKVASVAEMTSPPNTHFYLMVGEDDRGRIVNSMRELDSELRAAGAPVTLLIYPDLGNAFPTNRDEELEKAVSTVLGG